MTALFVRTLQEIVEAAGRPRWESVLAADSEDASPQAKVGFARLLDTTWSRLEEHVRSSETLPCSCTTPPRWPATRAAPTC